MKKTTQKLVDVIVDITCDVCGISVIPEPHKTHHENLDNFQEFGVLRASFGYGSNQDGSSFHFDLCEACFGQLVDKVENLRVSYELKK